MGTPPSTEEKHPPTIDHPRASAFYEWLAGRKAAERFTNPIRKEVVGQASGLVLEVGAGSGRNFPFYVADRVERVEAVEPDRTMLRYAQGRIAEAYVPINLVQAAAESLPFADETFDSAVATLVFCSVIDPPRALREVKRVLKPGGSFLLAEHVRAHGLNARIQDMLVPLTTRLTGNCHWNRDTEQRLRESGFELAALRYMGGGLQPIMIARAVKP